MQRLSNRVMKPTLVGQIFIAAKLDHPEWLTRFILIFIWKHLCSNHHIKIISNKIGTKSDVFMNNDHCSHHHKFLAIEEFISHFLWLGNESGSWFEQYKGYIYKYIYMPLCSATKCDIYNLKSHPKPSTYGLNPTLRRPLCSTLPYIEVPCIRPNIGIMSSRHRQVRRPFKDTIEGGKEIIISAH